MEGVYAWEENKKSIVTEALRGGNLSNGLSLAWRVAEERGQAGVITWAYQCKLNFEETDSCQSRHEISVGVCSTLERE